MAMSAMQRYRNLSGNSGVVAYTLHDDAIDVRFREGGVYRYDASAPGIGHVTRMRELALAGRGLATYINRHVRDDYAAKLSD